MVVADKVRTVEEIINLAAPLLNMPHSPIRSQIVDLARKQNNREVVIREAGSMALAVDNADFGFALSIARSAGWLVYFRKHYGIEKFEEVVNVEVCDWGS